jgi:hypothetical protein
VTNLADTRRGRLRALLADFYWLPTRSRVGTGFHGARWRALVALLVALTVTAHELKVVFIGWHGPSMWAFQGERWSLLMAAVIAQCALARGDLGSLGVRLPIRASPRGRVTPA